MPTWFTVFLKQLGYRACICLLLTGTHALAGNPIPFVNQPLSPGTAVPGGAGFTLTVYGANFVSGATVNWNGSARTTTFVSSSQVTASILASDIAAAGSGQVTVANPGSPASPPVFFEVTTPSLGAGFSSSQIAMTSGANTVVSGDFNGDRVPDLINAAEGNDSCGPSSYTIQLGNGDGTFTALPSVNLAAGMRLAFGLAVDINGDGKLDVVGFGCGLGIVLLGNGDGTFQPPETLLLAPTSNKLVAADFNRDGKMDLAALTNGGVSVLLGVGDGTFQPPIQYVADGDLAVGDFNGDGNLDLVSGNLLLLGNGDGTFQPGVSFTGGINSRLPTVGDLNGDGNLDVILYDLDTDSDLVVFLGNGDGTFDAGDVYDVSYGPATISLADVNGDGKLDIVVDGNEAETSCCGQLSTLLGNGDGTFQPSYEYGFTPSVYLIDLPPALADFNGDGRLDMAFVNAATGGVAVELGTTVLIFPNDVNFGTVNIGASSTAFGLTLTNVGSGRVTINSILLGGTDPTQFSIVSNNCGSTLALNASCTISLSCVPTLTGNLAATVLFSDSAPASPQAIPLACVGNGVTPVAQFSPTSLTFASQALGTTSAGQTVNMTNTGNANLLWEPALIGINPGDFSYTTPQPIGDSDSCVDDNGHPDTPPGATCTFTVHFTPSALGTRTASLAISSNDANSPQYVPLSGTGVPDPGLIVPSGDSPSATVSAGSTASYTLSVGGAGSSGTATLSCTGAPKGATCSVPPSVTVDAKTASTFKVSVTTTPPSSAMLAPAQPSIGWLWATALIALAFLPCRRPSVGSMQRRFSCLPILLIVFIVSCGGGGGGSSSGGGGTGSGGTPSGTYTLTVKAVLGGGSQSVNLMLIVQ